MATEDDEELIPIPTEVFMICMGGAIQHGIHQCSECGISFQAITLAPVYKEIDVAKEFVAHVEQEHRAEDGFVFRKPKEGDRIRVPTKGKLGEFVVVHVFEEERTARIKSISPPGIGHLPVPWKYLSYKPEKERS